MARELESKDNWEFVIFDPKTKQFIPVENGTELKRIKLQPPSKQEEKASNPEEYDN